MKSKANVVIIGGGINGTGMAYNLAKRGIEDIVLYEKRYLGAGASGRNGGGVRQQWTTKENILLAKRSVKIFEKLAGELGWNLLFQQGGYLIPAFSEEEEQQFKKNINLQNSLGVKSRYLTPEKAQRIVPMLNIEHIYGAAFNQTDGTLYPFAPVWGYARAARKMGVEIHQNTEVLDIRRDNNTIKSVVTNHGEIAAPIVVNVAGAFSRDIAKMAGIELPNRPYRHEIMVSEPLKLFLKPMVISFKHGIYFSQSMRGEIVGGIGLEEPSSYNIQSSPEFLEVFAKTLLQFIPSLRYVKLMRQWAGLYDVTPDAQPIMGDVEGVDGYYHLNGFSGHGIMISPAMTQMLTDLIVDGKRDPLMENLSLQRFAEGEVVKEAYVVG
ncbi:MAG: NAD(P)/FAD-dependent oxidoreductase [Candidatus Hodarchaeota archaeon]